MITSKWNLQLYLSWESTFPAVLGQEEIHLHKIELLLFFFPKSPGLPEASSLSCLFLNPWLLPNLHLFFNQDIWLCSQDQKPQNKGIKESSLSLLLHITSLSPSACIHRPRAGTNLEMPSFPSHQSTDEVSWLSPITCSNLKLKIKVRKRINKFNLSYIFLNGIHVIKSGLFFWAWFLKLSFVYIQDEPIKIFPESHWKWQTENLSKLRKASTWEGWPGLGCWSSGQLRRVSTWRLGGTA